MDAPPEGTIALLFTDIEGSTALVSRLGERWRDVLAEHHAIVGGAIAAEGGYVDGTEGDAFFATFADARRAARAAVAAQRALAAHRWPEPVDARWSAATRISLGERLVTLTGLPRRGARDGRTGAPVRRRRRRRGDALRRGRAHRHPADTTILWRRETFLGDLAMGHGRFEDALGHYAASLEVAQAIGNEVQVALDLQGVAWMLAELGRDEAALEAAGLSDAQLFDVGGSFSGAGVPIEEHIAFAANRLGEPAAGELRERGRAVPAGARVARAGALARQRTA